MTLRDIRILAIDDTPSIRTFLRISLENERAEFFEANTAEQGLELCKKLKPDLVILDLGLPDKDGLEILPEIKPSEDATSPQVIILTVRKGRETIMQAIKNGADAYLSKPFLVEDLLDTIESLQKNLRPD